MSEEQQNPKIEPTAIDDEWYICGKGCSKPMERKEPCTFESAEAARTCGEVCKLREAEKKEPQEAKAKDATDGK